MINARTSLVVAIVATLATVFAGTSHATTISGNLAGPNGSHDTWNNPANWDAGIPSGAVNAVVDTGVAAEAWNTATPMYSGSLTLMQNSSLQMGWTTNFPESFNAIGGGPVIMHEGSQIRLRLPFHLYLPEIQLMGDASILLSPSTSAHHRTREFEFEISGPGALTVIGNNNNTAVLKAASTFEGGFIADADDSWRVQAVVDGAFGTGDVTFNGRSNGDPARGASLVIMSTDTIDDYATLFLNGGRDHRLASKLILNADETIGAFFLDGVNLGVGTFNAASGLLTSNGDALISGNGTLTVTGITQRPGGAVPEPATAALALLGSIGLMARRRGRVWA